MEIDAELKKRLHEHFLSEVKRFLSENRLPLTAREFIHASVDAYRQWRRNPH